MQILWDFLQNKGNHLNPVWSIILKNHSPCGYSQVLYSGGRMRGQEVGTGVELPSVKKGMVAPVDKQNTGAEPSEDWMFCWLCGGTGPDARPNAPGDMVRGTPDGSCWEWLLVGISSLSTPPAPSSPSRSSSTGGALGTMGAGLRLGMAGIGAPWAMGYGMEGVKLTATFPMYMGNVTTASGDFNETCKETISQMHFRTLSFFFRWILNWKTTVVQSKNILYQDFTQK